MDRLLSEKAVLDILKNGKKYGERYYSMSQLIEIIKAIPSAYKGMTNGEVIESVFDVKEIHAMTVTIFVVLKDGTELEFKRNWWNASYK